MKACGAVTMHLATGSWLPWRRSSRSVGEAVPEIITCRVPPPENLGRGLTHGIEYRRRPDAPANTVLS
jgi:hypothetical protein